MNDSKNVKQTIVTLFAYMAGIALLLFVGLAGWGWYTVHQRSSETTRWLVDPALNALTDSEPKQLKGLSRRIHQFTTLHDAMALARDAGFQCDMPVHGSVSRDYTGPRNFVCPRNGETLQAGSQALVLRSWHPRPYLRGVELRQLVTLPPALMDVKSAGASVSAELAQALEQAPLIAAAKGIEFKSTIPFSDLLADRFDTYFHSTCTGGDMPMQHGAASACQEFRQRRTAQGLPKWNGQPLKAGTHEQALSTLQQLALECGPAQVHEPADAAAPEIARIVCTTRSFSGQVQSVTLETDARTAVPIAYAVSAGSPTVRMALAGSAPASNDDPNATSVIVKAVTGEARVFTLSMHRNSNSLEHAVKQYPGLDPGSQRRLMRALTGMTQTLLALPNPAPAVPQLQRLDATAAQLAAFGVEANTLASSELRGMPIDTLAVMALASCRLSGQAADCLLRFTISSPALPALLEAALLEAHGSMPGLPDDHPVRARLAQLAVQLKAATQ